MSATHNASYNSNKDRFQNERVIQGPSAYAIISHLFIIFFTNLTVNTKLNRDIMEF